MNGNTAQGQGLGVFHGACWVLGLVAFVEVAAIGMALALRRDDGRRTAGKEREEVVRYVAVGGRGEGSRACRRPAAPGAGIPH